MRRGAQVLDVCVQDPDRDEIADMRAFLGEVIKKVRVPLMIDSTDAKVIDEALTHCQGKSIINSINLEDGEERFERVVPLARKLRRGAGGRLHRRGQAAGAGDHPRSASWRSPALVRAPDREVRRGRGDLYFDPLVFPGGTGDQNYIGCAVETIEGMRLIKAALPRCKTVLGISNVSFGLPEAGREVLNSVMLYHCVQAGLDLAIVNSEKLERYPPIPEEERRLAEDLIWWRGEDPDRGLRRALPRAQSEGRRAAPALPLDERLARYILEGSKDGLIEDLDEPLKTRGRSKSSTAR